MRDWFEAVVQLYCSSRTLTLVKYLLCSVVTLALMELLQKLRKWSEMWCLIAPAASHLNTVITSCVCSRLDSCHLHFQPTELTCNLIELLLCFPLRTLNLWIGASRPRCQPFTLPSGPHPLLSSVRSSAWWSATTEETASATCFISFCLQSSSYRISSKMPAWVSCPVYSWGVEHICICMVAP